MSDIENRSAADQPWYRRSGVRTELRSYIAGQMGKGALYAACVFFGVLFFIWVLRLIAGILPEDPYAALDLARQTVQALA